MEKESVSEQHNLCCSEHIYENTQFVNESELKHEVYYNETGSFYQSKGKETRRFKAFSNRTGNMLTNELTIKPTKELNNLNKENCSNNSNTIRTAEKDDIIPDKTVSTVVITRGDSNAETSYDKNNSICQDYENTNKKNERDNNIVIVDSGSEDGVLNDSCDLEDDKPSDENVFEYSEEEDKSKLVLRSDIDPLNHDASSFDDGYENTDVKTSKDITKTSELTSGSIAEDDISNSLNDDNENTDNVNGNNDNDSIIKSKVDAPNTNTTMLDCDYEDMNDQNRIGVSNKANPTIDCSGRDSKGYLLVVKYAKFGDDVAKLSRTGDTHHYENTSTTNRINENNKVISKSDTNDGELNGRCNSVDDRLSYENVCEYSEKADQNEAVVRSEIDQLHHDASSYDAGWENTDVKTSTDITKSSKLTSGSITEDGNSNSLNDDNKNTDNVNENNDKDSIIKSKVDAPNTNTTMIDCDYEDMDDQNRTGVSNKANPTIDCSGRDSKGYLLVVKYAKFGDDVAKLSRTGDAHHYENTDTNRINENSKAISKCDTNDGVLNGRCNSVDDRLSYENVCENSEKEDENEAVIRSEIGPLHHIASSYDDDYVNSLNDDNKNTDNANGNNDNDSILYSKVDAPTTYITLFDCDYEHMEDQTRPGVSKKANLTPDCSVRDNDYLLAVKYEKVVDDSVAERSSTRDAVACKDYLCSAINRNADNGNDSKDNKESDLNANNATAPTRGSKLLCDDYEDTNKLPVKGDTTKEISKPGDLQKRTNNVSNDKNQMLYARSRRREGDKQKQLHDKEKDSETFLSENTFSVQVIESPSKVGILSGKFDLQIVQDGIKLLTKDKTHSLFWPFNGIRKYGSQKDKKYFIIEAGRRCESGPGKVVFKSEFHEKIYEKAMTMSKNR